MTRCMIVPAHYPEIASLLDAIDPVAYANTRNYTNGKVTRLSPYISRGVLSGSQVLSSVMAKGYTPEQVEKLLQELAWREYFQRTWQQMGDDIFTDIRKHYNGVQHRKVPESILTATTGIEAVDQAIRDLYRTGYMHNHVRMYTASITCNIGKADWLLPSQWMYYHLLDGDAASNACSWQWVAGTLTSRQYFCNQQNINTYTGTTQTGTFLDRPYETLPAPGIPEQLKALATPALQTRLPEKKNIVTDTSLPLLLYTSYNLDPLWRKNEKANRVLLLEPSHFRQFPVSENVMRFILQLAAQIEGLQVFTGEVGEIPGIREFPAVISKEHPAFRHFPGTRDERDWIFPGVTGYYPSFFRYWSQCKTAWKKNRDIIPQLKRA